MQIFLSPQVSSQRIKYTFTGDKIVAKIGCVKDTFDFTGMPDGVLEVESVETVLEPNPLLSARRENGVLYVELLNWIGSDATQEECFPEWIDSKDYLPLEEEEVPVDG